LLGALTLFVLQSNKISNDYKVPIRLTPMYAENVLCDNKLKADKLRRYEAISLENLYNNTK
jgi:hypothetical protein